MQNLQTALKDKSTLIFDKEDFELLKNLIHYMAERNASKKDIDGIFDYFAKTQTIDFLSKVKAEPKAKTNKTQKTSTKKAKQNKKG